MRQPCHERTLPNTFARLVCQVIETYQVSNNIRSFSMAEKQVAGLMRKDEKTLQNWQKGQLPKDYDSLLKLAEVCFEGTAGKLNEQVIADLFRLAKMDSSEALVEIFHKPNIASLKMPDTDLWVDSQLQAAVLPKYHVSRRAEMTKWRNLLCGQANETVFVMWGMAGTGKTTLTKALVLDPEVQEYFQDGFLWAELGPRVETARENVFRYLLYWCYLLGLEVAHAEEQYLELLRNKLKKEVDHRKLRLLVVIDDVWQSASAKELIIAGLPTLLITRDRRIAAQLELGHEPVTELGTMSASEAIELIRNRMGDKWKDEMRADALKLADQVGFLPLALALIAGVAVEWKDWGHVHDRLQKELGAIKTLRLSDEEDRELSLQAALNLSYRTLGEHSRRLFHHLGLFTPGKFFFKPDLDFIERSLELMWGGDSDAWEDALRSLVSKALVSEQTGSYFLHTVVSQYADMQLRQSDTAIDAHIHYIAYQWFQLASMTYGSLQDQTKLMETGWSDVARAWHKIQQLKLALKQKLDLGRLTAEFARLGCRILWRQEKWLEASQWADQALQIIEQTTNQDANRHMFFLWKIDGWLKQAQVGMVQAMAAQGENSSDADHYLKIRYKIRRTRCALVQNNLDQTKKLLIETTEDLHRISGQDKLLEIQVWAELYWLRGDFEAQTADDRIEKAGKAEMYWIRAAILTWRLGYQADDRIRADWWWTEEILGQIVSLRAQFGAWREALILGWQWVKLRQLLGLPVDRLLVQMAAWIIHTTENTLPAQAVISTLEGLKATRKRPEAYLVTAVRALKLAKEGKNGEAVHLIEAAVMALGKNKPLPPFTERKVWPYGMWPRGIPFEVNRLFDQWLIKVGRDPIEVQKFRLRGFLGQSARLARSQFDQIDLNLLVESFRRHDQAFEHGHYNLNE